MSVDTLDKKRGYISEIESQCISDYKKCSVKFSFIPGYYVLC